jgi:hypothetical protein
VFGQSKITKTKTVRGVKHDYVVGIRSLCEVKKSSIDVPYRKCPVYIVFGLGIDDVRANLEWYKANQGLTKFDAVDKNFAFVEDAIAHVEAQNHEEELRERVITRWTELQKELAIVRKPKVRL